MTALVVDHGQLQDDFDRLLQLASAVLNEHVNDTGLCAACGSTFPCGRALLAEHNLAVLQLPP